MFGTEAVTIRTAMGLFKPERRGLSRIDPTTKLVLISFSDR